MVNRRSVTATGTVFYAELDTAGNLDLRDDGGDTGVQDITD